jgi:hypothetical protein
MGKEITEEKRVDYSNLEETLRIKGVIKGSEVVSHEELLKDSKLFYGLSSLEHEVLSYFRYKQKIKETHQKTKSWDKVVTTAFYSDTTEGNEPFIDYVEELYQVRVKDAKHLQKLTGITAEDLDGLEDILFKAKYCRYLRTLQIALTEGAKYKDLLEINPRAYGLPETWEGELSRDQHTAILWAIYFEYLMGEPGGLMIAPSLKRIAQDLGAPYSVIMEAYQIARN